MLEWHRLELLCVAYFQALGFKAELTPFGGDGGVDIKLYAEGSKDCDILVQCKAWTRSVRVKEIRELHGVMAAEHVGEGIFVTTGRFTSDAAEFSHRTNINLIDGQDLLGKLRALEADKSLAVLQVATEGDFTTPTCPSCGAKMVDRTRGRDRSHFWGCKNYPRCSRTFSIVPETV